MQFDVIIFNIVSILVFLILAKYLNHFVMHINIKELLIDKENLAVGIQLSGYIFGVMIIIASVLSGPGHSTFLENVIWVSVYGLIGLFYMVFIAEWGIRIFIKGHILQLVKDGNISAGIVLAGSYISTAMVLSGAISGGFSTGGILLNSLFLLIIGLVLLAVFTFLFRLLTKYNDSTEIINGNIAAALSYTGLMIAVGLIIKTAISGDFVNWLTSCKDIGKSMLVILALYPIRQWILQGIMLGDGFSVYGGRLDSEISEHKNLNAGLIEGLTYLATAILTSVLI